MKTVLVVEDDVQVQTLLGHLLEENGYRPLLFGDGAEAWRRIQQGGIDMAVLDGNLPGMDGIEICRRIRSLDRFKGMPVLMLTIRGLVEDQLQGYDSGADDYLQKPFKNGILLARLKVLERRFEGKPSSQSLRDCGPQKP